MLIIYCFLAILMAAYVSAVTIEVAAVVAGGLDAMWPGHPASQIIPNFSDTADRALD